MTESPRNIAQKVVDHIYWDDRIEDSDIHVEEYEGHVVLSGTAANYLARAAAESVTMAIAGVKTVENQIEIRRSSGLDVPTDMQMKGFLEQMLAKNRNIDASSVRVEVRHGSVTLHGQVNACWKKCVIEELVASMPHVYDVRNRLAVIPSEARDDESIERDIRDEICKRHPNGSGDISVTVRNGVVAMSGTIEDEDLYRSAVQAAQYQSGVVNVVNKLKIRRRTGARSAD